MATPIVFISSTSEDLRPHRARARDAANRAGFLPRMQECFAASGNLPLEECLNKVSGSETEPPSNVVVAIVAYRYGWVPEGQSGPDRKSITWLECERADSRGQEVLAFLVDEHYDWPQELREEYRIFEATLKREATAELLEEVQANVLGLSEFKAWLNTRVVRATFTTPDSLFAEVLDALNQWRDRHPEFRRAAVKGVARAHDPAKYLRSLRESTAYIDIRGLQVGSGKAQRFPIDELFIPLTTTVADPNLATRGKRKEPPGELEGRGSARVALQEALRNPRLAIVADPGAGKTTFLRRIAFALCQSSLGEKPQAAEEDLGLPDRPFPIFIRLSQLGEHMQSSHGQEGAPTISESPAWLGHFLARRCKEAKLGLDEPFFRECLESGPTLVLLDGLDEASSQRERRLLSAVVQSAAQAYEKSRFVLTSRPAAWRGEVVLPGFSQVGIDALEDEAIHTFLARWCQGLFPESATEAQRHLEELLRALGERPEIRRMARNPVMLTALAVVHWHEKRLPEGRPELYGSILRWLACAREQRPGRPSPDRCVNLHQELALAMQDHPQGRQAQVPRFWAARAIAPQWREVPEAERVQRAEAFLREEELDSGIVVGRGDQVRFWHLTFQEYLAARGLAAHDDQRARLLSAPKLYQPEWREVVLLLAGVLGHQGMPRVDGMFSAVLDQLGDEAPLADQARCFGLLGAAVRDLALDKYQPADPRYKRIAEAVLGIFDAQRSQSVEIGVAIEAAEALGQAGDPRFARGNLERNWVEIPAGEFLMGAQTENRSHPNYDPEAHRRESAVHKVYLDKYQIGRYQVTVGEYGHFVDEECYQKEEYWQCGGFGEWQQPDEWEGQLAHPNRPVVGVSWYEASAYSAWARCRLPSEAQWERAARGTQARKYPWGSDAEPDPSLLNYWEGGIRHPTPVGVYPRGATPEGILDMAGNVWEWCHDWLAGKYPEGEVRNPTGPDAGNSRVVRGGSWIGPAGDCRSACRDRLEPTDRGVIVGFRLAR